jgi:xylulose-5-phosphate/fructose-6-phosphate phosphoketolase
MGGRSLLGVKSDDWLIAYGRGLGWNPVVIHVETGSPTESSAFHEALVDGINATLRGSRQAIFLRCVKGWSGPIGAHKTPLTNLKNDPRQRALLRRWMSTYRPKELFDNDAQPIGALASALDKLKLSSHSAAPAKSPAVASPKGRGFPSEVSAVLQAHAAVGDFKVFSPDELGSNRLNLEAEPWTHEILAEEVLLGWLAGWTGSGRRGVLISYEAFASLLLTGLNGHLKQRRLTDAAMPSINLLLTSYGWHNVYTHGDPSLVTALLGTGDPAVHVFTPADSNRAAYALDDALRSVGRVNVIVAGKHPTSTHPIMTIDQERRDGLAVWSHLSDLGEPDLTLVCAGDLAAAVISDVVPYVRSRYGCRLRVVNVHDLAALAGPVLHRYLGERAPVLIVTLGHPAAIWALLGGRVDRHIEVIGWREPPHPLSCEKLAAYAHMDLAGVTTAAVRLLKLKDRGR